MKSSRESVQRREDWREREGEGNMRIHTLESYTLYFLLEYDPQQHETSEWSFHMLCVISCILFLFSSSLPFLECDFSFFLWLLSHYLLSFLQELFHKHLFAVELAIPPWGSTIIFFFLFCADLWVSSAQLHFPPCLPSPIAMVFLESPGKIEEGKG